MVTSFGYKCNVVHSVSDGLQAAMNEPYQFIFLDCFLPDQTAWVASQAIRLLHRDRPLPLIVGILSCPDDTLKQKCSLLDMHGVLVKPICKLELSEVLGRARQSGISESSSHPTDHSSLDKISDPAFACVSYEKTRTSTEAERSTAPHLDLRSMVDPRCSPETELCLGELNGELRVQ
jgi:CheY-like chemotaxis protein